MELSDIIRDTWQTSLIFVSLLVFTRILGKMQVGQLTLYEYISGITIGSIAANIVASEPEKVWNHYYDLVLFIALTFLLSVITLKSRPMRKIIEGSPEVVIKNGLIVDKNMQGMRYDLDELTAQLRQKGVFDIKEIQYAILETSGDLSIIKKADYQALTKADAGIQTTNPSFPIELIMDGQIIESNLQKQNISKTRLDEMLAGQGINDSSQVEYAVIDSSGKFFVSPMVRKNSN